MKLLKTILCLTIVLIASAQVKADQRTSLNNVARDYFDMETAIATNNSAKASEKGQNLIWDLNTISDIGMTEAQHSKWFDYLNKTIRDSRSLVQAGSVGEQKQYFSGLSNDVFAILQLLNFNGFTVYKLTCKTDGHYWLSKTTLVKNPYYSAGDKNRSCGTPEEVLKAHGK